jgi:bifunctional UDP-N-acetylglucosamine pyrophosphorylase / glucosamine-1-phosphate N-acetyltransferase
MRKNNIGSIILAAGMGTRMKSACHKVLHPIGGLPLISHVLGSLDKLDIEKRVIVVGAERQQVIEAVGEADFVIQEPQLGTGHAVMAAGEAFSGFKGDILILYGDVPMVRAQTMQALLEARAQSSDGGPAVALAVLGFRPQDTASYGRMILNKDGDLDSIVEYKDASQTERAVELCNSGIMAVDGSLLFDLLAQISDDNANNEYYLTDIVAAARNSGFRVAVTEASEEEVMGVNSRADLAQAEAIFQARKRAEAMAGGASLTNPQSVYFSYDTKLGSDVSIEPNVFFGRGVNIGDNVSILAFSHLEGTTVASGASVGPFARLRQGTELGENVKIGNFVETKKAVIGEGAKISHLSYIGDANIGKMSNIGAGTITCNYDGFNKHLTDIGEGAFIGSNTSLVAPVKIGDGAIVGAGSTVTQDVEDNALAVERSEQKEVTGWATKYRDRQIKEKSKKGA